MRSIEDSGEGEGGTSLLRKDTESMRSEDISIICIRVIGEDIEENRVVVCEGEGVIFCYRGVGADEAWVRWGRYEITRANVGLGDDDIGDVGGERRLSRRQSSMIKV